MEICIKGTSRNVSKKEVRRILNWMAEELHLDRYKKPIRVEVQFIKGLRKNSGALGFCTWEDTNYRPRSFTIEVDTNSYKTKRTLIHEMIHVSQFAKGRLVDLMRCYSLKKWCGKLIDTTKVNYHDEPWEKEAYELETKYWLQYVERKKEKRRRKLRQ